MVGNIENTQDRIAAAAMACLSHRSFSKVTLNDIAKQAGVSRPTVYSYFKDRDEVLNYALLQSAYRFSDEIIKHVDTFSQPTERMLEAMLFCLKRLPEEPSLALISSPEVAQIINEYALISVEGNDICQKIFKVILLDSFQNEHELNEVIETCIRLLLSLLTLKSAKTRSSEEQRDFLQKRLLPSLGL